MRIHRGVLGAVLLLSSGLNWANGFELSSRVWLSSGETEWSHCASFSCGGGLGGSEQVTGAVAGTEGDRRVVADALDLAGGFAGHDVHHVTVEGEPDRRRDRGTGFFGGCQIDELFFGKFSEGHLFLLGATTAATHDTGAIREANGEADDHQDD